MIVNCDCLICDYNVDGECENDYIIIDDCGECMSRVDNPFKEDEENE